MPDFGSDAANELFADLAAPPAPEPPRIAAARRAMERVGSKAGRELVAAELIRSIPAGEDPTEDTLAILTLQAELDGVDDDAAEVELARQVAQALNPQPEPEPSAPYLDDQQRLRDPSGVLVDVMGDDWHAEPWYGEAAQLLRDAGYEHAEPETAG